MFCVECGSEGELHNSLCRKCYLAKNRFLTLTAILDVVICPQCGTRQKGRGWVQSPSDNMELLVKEVIMENAELLDDVEDFDISLTLDYEDERNMIARVISRVQVSSTEVKEETKVRLRIRPQVCPECSRQQGGYWEAKVQLRGSEKGMNEDEENRAVDMVMSLVAGRDREKGAFLTKVERMHGGLDFYLGSNNLGKLVSRELAQAFGGTVKESHKLVGRKEGKDVYRTTYAVRMSGFSVGDFVRVDDQIFQVKKISSASVLLRALESGRDLWFYSPDLERARIIGGKEMVKDMVVVSRSHGEIQVLDPDNLKTVDVLVPDGYDAGSESVRVMKCEAGYFLIE